MCPHCDRDINVYAYDEHLRKIHQVYTERNSRVKCDICGQAFASNSYLT